MVEVFAALVCFMAWVGSWWQISCPELSVTNYSYTSQRSKDLYDTWKGLNISIVAVILCCVVVWWYVKLRLEGRFEGYLFQPLSPVTSTSYNERVHRFVSSYYISSCVILLCTLLVYHEFCLVCYFSAYSSYTSIYLWFTVHASFIHLISSVAQWCRHSCLITTVLQCFLLIHVWLYTLIFHFFHSKLSLILLVFAGTMEWHLTLARIFCGWL